MVTMFDSMCEDILVVVVGCVRLRGLKPEQLDLLHGMTASGTRLHMIFFVWTCLYSLTFRLIELNLLWVKLNLEQNT